MNNAYEKVHTMTDYYDGPRGGVADFKGSPVVYESEFADFSGGKDDTFLLQPISKTAFDHALDDWEIWLKWECAYKQGLVDVKTHPALPEDRQRHEELVHLLVDELKIDEQSAIRANGASAVVDGEVVVQWEVLSDRK